MEILAAYKKLSKREKFCLKPWLFGHRKIYYESMKKFFTIKYWF